GPVGEPPDSADALATYLTARSPARRLRGGATRPRVALKSSDAAGRIRVGSIERDVSRGPSALAIDTKSECPRGIPGARHEAHERSERSGGEIGRAHV